MIKHFIWDFDGMLFDTYPHTLAAFCETCRRFGVSYEEDEVFAHLKVTVWHALTFYGFDAEMKAAFYAVENDLDYLPRGKPYPMIPHILEQIVNNGGKNYLYTHRDRVAVRYLERYGLEGLFADTVTRELGFPHKPAPDAIEYLIQKHGLQKDECLMLGDRLIDIGSGRNAGVHTCLFDEFGDLPEAECDYRCRTTEELSAMVETMTGGKMGICRAEARNDKS